MRTVPAIRTASAMSGPAARITAQPKSENRSSSRATLSIPECTRGPPESVEHPGLSSAERAGEPPRESGKEVPGSSGCPSRPLPERWSQLGLSRHHLLPDPPRKVPRIPSTNRLQSRSHRLPREGSCSNSHRSSGGRRQGPGQASDHEHTAERHSGPCDPSSDSSPGSGGAGLRVPLGQSTGERRLCVNLRRAWSRSSRPSTKAWPSANNRIARTRRVRKAANPTRCMGSGSKAQP